MSRPSSPSPDWVPLIALVHRLDRALQEDMPRAATRLGYGPVKPSFNVVFATLEPGGSRAARMADEAGITRQSMGEVIREMVELGLLELKPDPADRRAKLVTWTDQGLELGRGGYQHILALEDRLAAELGAAEYAWLRDALARITTIVTTFEEDAAPPRKP